MLKEQTDCFWWGTYFDVRPRGIAEVDVLELYVSFDGVRLEASI